MDTRPPTPLAAPAPLLRERHWQWLLCAGSLLILGYLLWRNHGLSPSVLADELVYSTYARLAPAGESIVPSYLYFWLFGASNACGSAFLDCVRVANAIFFVASAPFLYLSARTVCTPWPAVAVTLAALAGPVNASTAWFMPEAVYFFSFSVLAWASLRWAGHWLRLGLAGGVILGLMSLLKVHALFLIPAQCLFAFGALYLSGGPWLRRACGAAALTLIIALALRVGLGYLLAGAPGLHLFGPLYGDHAGGSAGRMLGFLPFAWANLKGHLMGLALMFTFPLALVAYGLAARRGGAVRSPAVATLQLYALLALGASLGLTVLYSASLYSVEGLRLHARYYNFTFPFLFMIAAAGTAMPAMPTATRRLPAVLLALAGGAALLYAVMQLGSSFRILLTDGAEVGALLGSGRWLWLLAAVQLLVLAAWLVRVRLAAILYLALFLPLFVLLAGQVTHAFVTKQRTPSLFDQAGQFARARLAPDELAQLTVMGAGMGDLMRVKFHLDAPRATLVPLDEGAPLDLGQAPVTSQWVLVTGSHTIAPQFEQLRGPGYTLVRLPAPAQELARIDLRSPAGPPAALASAQGLSYPELWGRWSTGKVVTLRLKQAMPRQLVLSMSARAFGPNVGQDIIVRVGGQERRFQLEAVDRERSVQFDTDGRQTELTFIVPHPTRPTAGGKVLDVRTLGLGLNEIRIATPGATRH